MHGVVIIWVWCKSNSFTGSAACHWTFSDRVWSMCITISHWLQYPLQHRHWSGMRSWWHCHHTRYQRNIHCRLGSVCHCSWWWWCCWWCCCCCWWWWCHCHCWWNWSWTVRRDAASPLAAVLSPIYSARASIYAQKQTQNSKRCKISSHILREYKNDTLVLSVNEDIQSIKKSEENKINLSVISPLPPKQTKSHTQSYNI